MSETTAVATVERALPMPWSDYAEVSRVGVQWTREITQDEWTGFGRQWATVESGRLWVIGDWAAACKWGGKYEPITEATGLSYQTVADCRYVAARIQFSRRRENLSFKHHRVVAPLDPDDQDYWLVKAEREGWSEKQLRLEVNGRTVDLAEATTCPTVTLGDWWQLGRHSLYCGDTSKDDFISALPKAALAFADPPYGADVAEWDHQFYWEHDYLAVLAPIVAVTPGIVSIFDFAQKTRMPYAWSLACWVDNGMTRGALGFGNWIYTALFATTDIYQGRPLQDVLRISISVAETSGTSHKGRKPSAYMRRMIEIFTKEGDIILDPFLGSGQTLLIAEKTGRTCMGGEINPQFCAEIIGRFETMTGTKAVKVAAE